MPTMRDPLAPPTGPIAPDDTPAADPADAAGLALQHEAVRQRIMRLFRHTAHEPGCHALLHAVLKLRQEQCR